MKVNHIGVITSDLSKSIRMYSKMGYVLAGDIVRDQIQNNYIAFMNAPFPPNIELIMPMNENSSVYNFKDGYHHICYETEGSTSIIAEFKKMKVGKIFTLPLVAPALANQQVVFAYLQNGTFVELIL